MREPGSRDAGSLCLDTWSRGRAWPYRCSGGHRARLAGEGQIERFSGAWPGACEWELRAESTDARTAHTPRQPINFMLSHATCAQTTKQRAFACAGPTSVEPGSVMRAWLAWEDNQSDPLRFSRARPVDAFCTAADRSTFSFFFCVWTGLLSRADNQTSCL